MGEGEGEAEGEGGGPQEQVSGIEAGEQGLQLARGE